MSTNDRDFAIGGGGEYPKVTYETITLYGGDVANGEADTEWASVRVPYDCQIISAYAWARAVGSTAQTVELEDDGTDISDATEIGSGGAQTEITGITSPTRLAEGSELQVRVDTSGASESFTGLVVTVTIRPYPLGEAASAVS